MTDQQQQFACQLAAMKAEAGRLGLWRTMHAMDAALLEVGFEIGDSLITDAAERRRHRKGADKYIAMRTDQ